MKIRTVQWNIGGAHIRNMHDDKTKSESYIHENLPYIVEYLNDQAPDIITLQESHADNSSSQAKTISDQLGLQYYINDAYDESHIDPTQKLCQTIISRFPIKQHSFSLFFNPQYRKIMEDGSEWVSHNKGISTGILDLGESELTLQTLHLIPFSKFNANIKDEKGKVMIESIEMNIDKVSAPYLLQGDFNYEDARALLPGIFSNGLYEIAKGSVTTPRGKSYDHVLFRGIKENLMPVVDDKVLTDHYPIISQFKF